MAVNVCSGLVFVDGRQQLHSTSLSLACLPCHDRHLSLHDLEQLAAVLWLPLVAGSCIVQATCHPTPAPLERRLSLQYVDVASLCGYKCDHANTAMYKALQENHKHSIDKILVLCV